MQRRVGAACAGALMLAGCASPYTPAPVARNFPTTTQAKLQAAAHWQVISQHIERELGPAIKNAPHLPLYVQPPQSSPFNQAVANQLITSLVNDGFVVLKVPKGALTVEIDTQVVEFSADRPQYKFRGEHIALVAGVWALTEIDVSHHWLAAAAIAGRDAYDWFRTQFASGDTPKTEIIVTVGVSNGERYFARYTSVYYTTDNDRTLYQAVPLKSFAVRGEGE